MSNLICTEKMRGLSIKVSVVLLIATVLGFHVGCASTNIWLSAPEKHEVTRAACTVAFEPIKKDKAFFSLFRLSITNHTDKALEVDWNKTQYLFNGKPNGPFVFKGVDPENVKNLTIPANSIPAGGLLTMDIAPFRLIAWAPVRDEGRFTSEAPIAAGYIPPGVSGISLVLRKDGKEETIKMAVTIRKEAAP
ncbi:MAG: hypothetical protein P8165_04230 [Deltaproteobacteria bacterium]|jgi:hypothetical protein